MVETQDLELLQAVVRCGSLRAAAVQVHLSQPAMTRRIQAIERRLGVRLFLRTGRRLEPTEAGAEFLRRADEILLRLQELEEEMAAHQRGQRGLLRIGATVTVCLYLLPALLRQMQLQHPQYELSVVNETSQRMPVLVREGRVDLGIASIAGNLEGLQVLPWRKLHLGMLTGEPPASNSVKELEGQRLVVNAPGSLRDAVDRLLLQHEVRPRIVAQADSLEVVRVLVECGFGSAVVPVEVMEDDAARTGLALTRLEEATTPLQVAAFYRHLQPPVRTFLSLLAE